MFTQVGVPTNQFAANLDGAAAFGFNMQHLRQLGDGPFSIGAGMNLMGYGGDCWDEYWSFGENVYDAEYSIENCVMDFEGRMRFTPQIPFPLQPYGEAFAGISTISTSFVVSDRNISDDCNNTLYEEILSRDIAPVYGVGFGLMVPICRDGGMFLDLGATYRNSGTMTYMNDDFDQVFNSRTDMWLVRVGLTVSTF